LVFSIYLFLALRISSRNQLKLQEKLEQQQQQQQLSRAAGGDSAVTLPAPSESITDLESNAPHKQPASPSSTVNNNGASSSSSADPNPNNTANDNTLSQQFYSKSLSVFQLAKEGLTAAKDPKILLGYIGSFLARGDTIIITLFLPLWIYKAYIDNGTCSAPSIEDPELKDVCRPAYLRASALSGLAQTFALVGAPIFGRC
jgi:hypothetical protein